MTVLAQLVTIYFIIFIYTLDVYFTVLVVSFIWHLLSVIPCFSVAFR